MVRDGDAAGAILHTRGAPLLLITDLSLPGRDGLALIRDLRQLSSPDETAVLVLSAFPELRAIAARMTTSLGIAHVADERVSRDALGRIVRRALDNVTAPPTQEARCLGLGDLFQTLRHQIMQILPVPIVTLSIDTGSQRWFTAHVLHAMEPGDATVSHQSSLLRQVTEARQPFVVQDTRTIPIAGVSSVIPSDVRGVVLIPLLTSLGQSMGVLSLLDVKPLAAGIQQVDRMVEVGRSFADELERRQQVQLNVTRSDEQVTLEHLVLVDSLTGLYNRRAGEQAIVREAARVRRTGSQISVVLLGLDNFQLINDMHGHEAGDRALREVARILRSSFRQSDLAVRWGGDEFLVVLPDVSLAGAAVFAERARQQLEALLVTDTSRVTVSAAVSTLGAGESPAAAISRAEASLNRARAAGRNRAQGVHRV